MDNSVYEYYKKKINDWYNESPSTRGAFPRFPDPSTNKDQYFIYLNLHTYGPDVYNLNIPLWDYAGGAFYELPVSSKIQSANLNITNLSSLTGISFTQTTTSATSGMASTSTGLAEIRNTGGSSTKPTDQKRYGSADAMERVMLNTATSSTTAPLPSTVLVAIRGSLSGDFQTASVEYLPVQIPPNTLPTNFPDIRRAIAKAMKDKGFSRKEISEFLKNNQQPRLITLPNDFGKNGGSGPRGSGGSGGNKNSDKFVNFGITPTPEVNKKVIVRFGRSYTLPQAVVGDSRPMMIQWITNSPIRTAADFQNGRSVREEDRIIFDQATNQLKRWSTQQATLKYIFPYVPTDIQYSSLGAQWTEVPRTKYVPYVDFQGFQRMKVSFSFIISSTRVEPGGTEVPDGLFTSVDEQITLLRKMYQSKQPVTIYNMDSLLSNPVDRLNNNPVQFVIADLGIEAVRRQGTSPSHITTAQCSITLNEILVENAVLIRITEPKFDEFIPRRPGKGSPGTTASRPELWSTYLPQPQSTLISSSSQMAIE
jgi:hypothetical protein